MFKHDTDLYPPPSPPLQVVELGPCIIPDEPVGKKMVEKVVCIKDLDGYTFEVSEAAYRRDPVSKVSMLVLDMEKSIDFYQDVSCSSSSSRRMRRKRSSKRRLFALVRLSVCLSAIRSTGLSICLVVGLCFVGLLVCLPVCLRACLPARVYVRAHARLFVLTVSVCMYLLVFLFVYFLFACLFICLTVGLSVGQSACLPAYLPVHTHSVCLSVCKTVCLVCRSVYLSAYYLFVCPLRIEVRTDRITVGSTETPISVKPNDRMKQKTTGETIHLPVY